MTPPPVPSPVPRPASAVSRIVVLLLVSVTGAAAVVGGYWFFKIRPRTLAIENPYYGNEPRRAKTLRAIDPSSDFDLAFELPGRPQGAASDGRAMIVANGSDPWGALRIAPDGDRSYASQSIPIIETGYRQKIALNTLTWNGRNYVGYTTGSWFGKAGDVFTIHDPKTLQVLETRPAPPLLGGLAWDGAHYWASTRKNTQAAAEEAFFYKIDPAFQIVAKHTPPGIGCQGLAWDGERLWYCSASVGT